MHRESRRSSGVIVSFGNFRQRRNHSLNGRANFRKLVGKRQKVDIVPNLAARLVNLPRLRRSGHFMECKPHVHSTIRFWLRMDFNVRIKNDVKYSFRPHYDWFT